MSKTAMTWLFSSFILFFCSIIYTNSHTVWNDENWRRRVLLLLNNAKFNWIIISYVLPTLFLYVLLELQPLLALLFVQKEYKKRKKRDLVIKVMFIELMMNTKEKQQTKTKPINVFPMDNRPQGTKRIEKYMLEKSF